MDAEAAEMRRYPCSIVIPVFNKVEYTVKCLESLLETTPPHLYEVVLVDNGSTDGTADLLACLGGDVQVITNAENLGFSKACNQGARAAKGEHLLFLNNDTEAWEGWLEPLLVQLQENPDVGAVGSRLLFPDGTLQHAGVEIIDDRRSGIPVVGVHRFYRLPADHGPALVRTDLQVVTGASMLVRGDAFWAVGGFDERYWNGYEDIDLCFKLGAAGWRIVYEPASCLVHHESVSGPERFVKVNDNVRLLVSIWKGKVVPDAVVHADGRVVTSRVAMPAR